MRSGRDRTDSDPGRRRDQARSTQRKRSVAGTVPDHILQRLDTDPLFQVITRVRREWIDPFSGESVSAPDGIREAAQEHWQASGSWRLAVPHSLEQLVAIRWRVDLRLMLPDDRRLRQFGVGKVGWLNPFSGEFEATVQRDGGRISLRTVSAMSQVLARCPFAEAGIMLDESTLKKRLSGLSDPDSSGANELDEANDSESAVLDGISDDLKRATDVQRNMLGELPKIPGWEIGVSYLPQAAVSGDFYEVIQRSDGSLLVVVGDVSGHGVQAALVVVSVLKTLRQVCQSSPAADVVEITSKLNDDIKPDLLPGQFVTAFVATVDPVRSEMTCVLAGHHHLLLAQPGSSVLLCQAGIPGMAMGLVVGKTFMSTLKPETIKVEPGMVLVQYTDGLVEAMNGDGEEFGALRFAGSILASSESSPEDLTTEIVRSVQDFAGGEVDDDLTILALTKLKS